VTINPDFDQPDIDDYPELRAALANGGSVALSEDVTVKAPLVVEGDKTVEIDLNGKNIINETSLPDGQYGNTTVFEVKGGATLNIRGDGDIHAIGTKPNEDGYRMVDGSITLDVPPDVAEICRKYLCAQYYREQHFVSES